MMTVSICDVMQSPSQLVKYMSVLFFWDLSRSSIHMHIHEQFQAPWNLNEIHISPPFSGIFSHNRYEHTYVNIVLANDLEFDANTYASKSHREFDMYSFPLGW